MKRMNTHTHTHSLIQTVTLGQRATMVWLPQKGRQRERLWPKKCSPDQSHMHLALHLYHVSALACRGLEKFRSALRETQVGTSRTAGKKKQKQKRWKKNWLIFVVELTSAFFQKMYLADSHVLNLKGPFITCLSTSPVQNPLKIHNQLVTLKQISTQEAIQNGLTSSQWCV